MRLLSGHRAAVTRLAYAPDDPLTLASASLDGTIRLWNPLTGENWATFTERDHLGLCLAFSPDGALLAADGPRGATSVWDVVMQRRCHTYRLGGPGGELNTVCVRAVAFLDGNVLVVGRADEGPQRQRTDLGYWEVGVPERGVRRDWFGGVRCLAPWPRRKLVAVAAAERNQVDLWEPEGLVGVVRGSFRTEAPVHCLAFSNANPPLLAVGMEEVVELRETVGWTRLTSLTGHTGDVGSLSFSPDGRLLLVSDETVRMWDVESGRERVRLDWGLGKVWTVTFSPDGTTAAAAGETFDIVVWDVD